LTLTQQYLVCMSCDSYQPTNLESVLPLSYTNVILYLYVVCLGIDDIQRTERFGCLHGTSPKGQWFKLKQQQQKTMNNQLKIPRFKRRFTDGLLGLFWFWIQWLRGCFVSSFQTVFSIVKKGCFEVQRLSFTQSSQNELLQIWWFFKDTQKSYAIYSAFSQAKSLWMLTNTKETIFPTRLMNKLVCFGSQATAICSSSRGHKMPKQAILLYRNALAESASILDLSRPKAVGECPRYRVVCYFL